MTSAATKHWSWNSAVDVAAVTVATLVAATSWLDAVTTGDVTGIWLAVAIGGSVVGCAALWWRHRWPVAVALLLLPLSAVTDFVYGAVLIASFTVAVRRPRWVVLTLVGLHILAATLYSLILPYSGATFVVYNGVNFVLIAVVTGWGMAVRSRREVLATLRERAARAEADARVREERLRSLERERIAREMHDVLAHRISLVSLHAGALEIRPDLSAEQVAEAAATIRASAHQALEDLRGILGVLRHGALGGELRPQPGAPNIDELVEECRSAGTSVRLDRRIPDSPPLPTSVGRTAYRIVQEGLTNARKHAAGCEVRIRLDRTPAGELHVWLRNPFGAGRSQMPGAHSGLFGLAERVDLAGGRLDHGARRGDDGAIEFHLEAWIPWPA